MNRHQSFASHLIVAIVIALLLAFALASTVAGTGPSIVHKTANITVHFFGTGNESDGLIPEYGFEFFLQVTGDDFDPGVFDLDEDIAAYADGLRLSFDYGEMLDLGGGQFFIEVGGNWGATPPPLAEYSVTVTDTMGVAISEVIGGIDDYPRDAPEFLYPNHLNPMTDASPTFSWDSFESNYSGSSVTPWAYEINLAPASGDRFTVWPIDPGTTSLPYVNLEWLNDEWTPEQPPPLEPDIHLATVHSNHSVAENIMFEHHRTILLVVYDPEAGFVTGGGYIGLDGEEEGVEAATASFGLVAKYNGKGNYPTGNLQFQFQEENINFHADSFLALWVRGNEARLSGTGKINGQEGYEFRLTLVDGHVSGGAGIDWFALSVRNAETQETTFDSGPREVQGSIVVHQKK